MASTSAGSSKNDSKRQVKIIHHEKGESIVIFWSIQTFDYFLRDLEHAITLPFTVNGSSGLEWCIILHFRKNTDCIGVTLKLLSPIPRDLRVTWSVAVVHHCDDSYVCDKITCDKKIMNSMSVSHLTKDSTFLRLIKKHVLMNEHEKYIKNGTLTLKVKLNTYASMMSSNCFAPSEYFKIITEADTICNLMKHLYETSLLSDFTLVAYKSVHNKVHKSVLSARSREFASRFANLPKQNINVIRDMSQETLSALLAYIYTGNPYDIGCIPLLLQKTARKHGLPLLEHFTEPNTLSFSSRIKVKQKKLVLKVKNFFSQINTEEHKGQQRIILVDFGIGDSLRNTWELFLDLRENNRIYFRLERTSCKHVPFKTVFKTFVLNNLNRYECLGTHEMMCNGLQRARCSFVINAKNIRFNQHNHLTLQILVKVSFSLIRENNYEYKIYFFSELCEAIQTMPPDFVQLKRDVFEMYNSKLYPNLVLLLASDPRSQVLVHKFMVGLHSTHIKDALDNRPQQSVIPLEAISRTDLEIITRFMYTGFICDFDLQYLGHLLFVAKSYNFIHLRKVILEILRSNLNIGNASEIFRIACECEEEELEVEAFRVSHSRSDTNLPSTSQANTSGNDQVTSPHTGMRSQDALRLCQSRVEQEYTELRPRTSKESGKRSQDAVRVRQSIVEREYAETSIGTIDERGLSNQDAIRVSQTRVESEYVDAGPQTGEESPNNSTILQHMMDYLNETVISIPGIEIEDPVSRTQTNNAYLDPSKLLQAFNRCLEPIKPLEPFEDMVECSQLGVENKDTTDCQTGMENLNPQNPGIGIEDPVSRTQINNAYFDRSKLLQAFNRCLEPIETLKPFEDMVECSQLGVENKDATTDCRTGMENLNPQKLFQELVAYMHPVKSIELDQDAVTSPQQGGEREGVAREPQMYEKPEKIMQDIIDLLHPRKSPEPSQNTIPRYQLNAETKNVAPDPRTSIQYLDSVKSVEPTARYLDRETSVQPDIKSQPTVKRTNLAVESKHSLENKNKVVYSGLNVEDLGPSSSFQYAMGLEGLAPRDFPLAINRGLIPSSRAMDKNKDLEAKGSVKNKDPAEKKVV